MDQRLELSYQKIDDSLGWLDCEAVLLERDFVCVVKDEWPLQIARYNGAAFNLDDTPLTPGVEPWQTSLWLEAPSGFGLYAGPRLLATAEEMRFETSTQGIDILADDHVVASWRDVPGRWFAGDEEVGESLLVTKAGERFHPESPIDRSPRSRPSHLAERRRA